MTPSIFIRKHVLRMTQEQLAAELCVTQTTTCRWDKGGAFPSWAQIKIREIGRAKRSDWSDSWFFEVPEEQDDAV